MIETVRQALDKLLREPKPYPYHVERRDPATYRQPSTVDFWRCPTCRSYTMNGAHLTGRCNFCGEPRP